MADAKRDANRIATLLAVSSVDSITPIAIEAEPTNKALNVNITGSTTLPISIAIGASLVSTVNSTTATLGIGAAFTGTAEDVSSYKSVGINVIASHASAANGLSLEFSSNGTNWDTKRVFTIPADTGKFFNMPVEAKYFRVVYTNGATGQTAFRLQTIYHGTVTKESTLRLGDAVDVETAASLSRSVVTGLDVGSGLFKNVNTYDTGVANALISLVTDASNNPIEVLATGADDVVNTTNALVTAGMGYVFDGTAWDRMRGTSADGILVNLGSNNDVSISGNLPDTAQGDLALLSSAVKQEDTAHATTDKGFPAWAVRNDARTALAADGDYIPLIVNGAGALHVDPLPLSTTWLYADINDASSGDNTIIAATESKKIAVWSVLLVSDGTVDARFEDGAGGTAFTGQIPLQAREGFSHTAGGLVPLWVGTANTLLNLELSDAINVHGSVAYTLVT
jgi:hypothetical protein